MLDTLASSEPPANSPWTLADTDAAMLFCSVLLLEVSSRLAAEERAEAIAGTLETVGDVTVAQPADVVIAA